MPLDVDAVFGHECIGKLITIFDELPHMGRSDMCDDIERFVNEMKDKYETE